MTNEKPEAGTPGRDQNDSIHSESNTSETPVQRVIDARQLFMLIRVLAHPEIRRLHAARRALWGIA